MDFTKTLTRMVDVIAKEMTVHPALQHDRRAGQRKAFPAIIHICNNGNGTTDFEDLLVILSVCGTC